MDSLFVGIREFPTKRIILIAKEDRINNECLETLIHGDLRQDTFVSVKTYTDWLASRIVRKGDYSVPTLEEINHKSIKDKVQIRGSKILDRAINYMHSQPTLPLLGKIEDGHFKPDHKEFEKWKSCYGWSV